MERILIEYYWNDSPHEFHNENAMIGEDPVHLLDFVSSLTEHDDNDIFYYFEHECDIVANHGDFTVVSYYKLQEQI